MPASVLDPDAFHHSSRHDEARGGADHSHIRRNCPIKQSVTAISQRRLKILPVGKNPPIFPLQEKFSAWHRLRSETFDLRSLFDPPPVFATEADFRQAIHAAG